MQQTDQAHDLHRQTQAAPPDPAEKRALPHPARLPAVLHYDGTPITARFIVDAIRARVP
jgi:hypothetical protein